MAGSQPPGESLKFSPELLFATFWLVPHEAGETADFEALCEQFPEQAAALRELYAQWARIESVRHRHGLSGSFAERLRTRYGSEIEVDVSLQGPAEPAREPDGGLLARLASHARGLDRFKLEGELARGGMGVILRVWDAVLRRHLAMKVVLAEDEPRADGAPEVPSEKLARFLEEAQISGQLDHPGIVPVHELGLDAQGRVYFTMKLVRGQTLNQVFQELAGGRGGWTQTRVLGLLLKVCEAMAYAHDKRVIHRDLKPANVMVGRYGEVYVMDWGVAKVLDREDRHDLRLRNEPPTAVVEPESRRGETPLVTRDGRILGTPAYMSPEQAAGLVADMGPQADVYSVGAMLYHLLSGGVPYTHGAGPLNHLAVLMRVQEGPPEPLHELAPEAPAELVAICEKAMAREPRERYPDMSALAQDLSAFLEGRVVRAYRVGPWAEVGKWVQRNRALAASLLAAALIAFGGLASVGWVQARGKRVAREHEKVATARADDVLRLSALQNLEELHARAEELWPPYPDKIEGLRAWLADAQSLLPDLPRHRAKRDELRALALPQSAAERAAERESHPDHGRLVAARDKLECERRALLQRRDGVPAALPEVSFGDEPATAKALNAKAWPLVAPGRKTFGREPLGLVLAQRALELSEEGSPERAMVGDTLAWALFCLGRDAEALEAERSALADARADGKEDLAAAASSDKLEQAVADASSSAALRAAEEAVAQLEALIAELDLRVDEGREWRFDEEHEGERWWNDQLSRLIAGLEDLTEPQTGLLSGDGISVRQGWSIQRRLALAERMRASFAPGGEHGELWAAALPKLRAAYPGLELAPQMGLVPLGPDQSSGLWEFAHLATGTPPLRGADGRLVLTEGTGVVLVLLPGGSFSMGAQRGDPKGPNYDPQAEDREVVREVSLPGFFLSKYELTQGQWLRITGANPSMYQAGNWNNRWLASHSPVSLMHPVEQVNWFESVRALKRMGLMLPTQAQWEYGARAGTHTPWFTGAEKELLQGAANVVDRYSKEHGDPNRIGHELWMKDDATMHAPVGSYAPNPFGLHDVAGNVWEWCLDHRTPPDTVPVEEALRLLEEGGVFERELRGGSFHYPSRHCRATHRSIVPSPVSAYDVGARPALNLTD